MVEINIALIKELRNRVDASIMDCKKALLASDGNIELAIENMHKFNTFKALKRNSAPTTNGIIKIQISNDCSYGVMLEINCQTDFVAKNSNFQKFADNILHMAFSQEITDVNILREQCKEERIALISKICENVNIRRISIINGNTVSGYLHNTRIGVLVAARCVNKEFIKHIAMHIAASNPKYIKPDDIPAELIKNIYQVQLDISMQSGKNKAAAEIIAMSRMKNFINEVSLSNQTFVMDQNKTISQVLEDNDAVINNFIRFEVGEEIN